MKSLLASVSIACVLLNLDAGQAMAWPVHLGSGSVFCAAQATFPDEHCAPYTDGVDIFPSFFSGTSPQYTFTPGVARQSGQTYLVTPPYDVAGVGFAIGPSAAQYHATDPNTITGQGCTFSSSGSRNHTAGAWVQCTGNGGGVLDLEGYNFAQTSSNVNPCVYLEIVGAGYSTIRIKHNRWVNGSGCQQTQAKGTGYAGAQFQGYLSGTQLCVQTSSIRGTIVIGQNLVYLQNNTTGNQVIPGAGDPITAQSGTCAAGFTGYTITNSHGDAAGTSAAPVTIGEATNTLIVTTTSGTLVASNQTYQGLDGTGGLFAGHFTCSPACGGPGTYTLTTDTAFYSPSEKYIFGVSVAGFINVVNGGSPVIDVESNHIDGLVGKPGDIYADPTDALAMDNATILNSTGTNLTYAYNVVLNVNARVANSASSSLDVYGNFVMGYGYNPSTSHLEIILNGPSGASYSHIHYWNNTVVATTNMETHLGTANLWIATSGYTVGEGIMKYNTLVANRANPANDATPLWNLPGSGDGSGAIMQAAGFETQDGGGFASFVGAYNYFDQEAKTRPCYYTSGTTVSDGWMSNNINMVTGASVNSWANTCGPSSY